MLYILNFRWDSLIPSNHAEIDTFSKMADDDPCKLGVTWKILHGSLPSPRTIKSHLHKDLLPKQFVKKAKVKKFKTVQCKFQRIKTYTTDSTRSYTITFTLSFAKYIVMPSFRG